MTLPKLALFVCLFCKVSSIIILNYPMINCVEDDSPLGSFAYLKQALAVTVHLTHGGFDCRSNKMKWSRS